MIGVLFVFVVSLIGGLLAMIGVPNFMEMDFVTWLLALFGEDYIFYIPLGENALLITEYLLWAVVAVVGLVFAVLAAKVAAKKMNRTLETQRAKKLTSWSCIFYALLVIPAVFVLRSIVIVGEGSIGDFWILFLFATLDAIAFVGVAGALNRAAERADKEALDEANAA